jgi:hypothetical protein
MTTTPTTDQRGPAMTARTTLPPIVRDLAERALLLAAELPKAEGIQWTAAPVPRPREDTTERASGGHGDPTFATVSDDRRLAVRAAVLTSYDALEQAIRALIDAEQDLRRAVTRYYDDDTQTME